MPRRDKITIEQAVANFFRAKQNKAPSTLVWYHDTMNHLNRILFQRYKYLESITEADIEDFKTFMLNHGFSNGTIAKGLEVLTMLFHMNDIRRKFKRVEAGRRERFLTKDELEKLLFVAESYPLAKLMILIAMYTGLRHENVRNLTWNQIDFHKGTISVIAKGSRPLTVPMSHTLAKILFESKPFGARSTDRVIRGAAMRYLEIKACCVRAGLHNIVFHTFRHSFISNLIMNNVDLPTVAELVDHKDIRTTMRYVHLTDTHRREAVNKAWEDKKEDKPNDKPNDSSGLNLVSTSRPIPIGKSMKPSGQISLFG